MKKNDYFPIENASQVTNEVCISCDENVTVGLNENLKNEAYGKRDHSIRKFAIRRDCRQLRSIRKCERTAESLKNELADGTLFNLNIRNCYKSENSQIRIVRRIVEKRLAQVVHQKTKRRSDLYVSKLSEAYKCLCMQTIINRTISIQAAYN